MVRNLLFILLAFFVMNISAQVTVDPENISIKGNPSEELITFKFDLTNSGADDVQLYWTLEKASGFPAMWATQVCDFQLCYGENVDTIATSLPNTLKAGETRDFKIYLLPNEVTGEADLTFRIYDDENLSNELIKMNTDQVTVSNTTSVKSYNLNDLNIYPNPSTNYFQISNDEKVSKIIIYNIAGRRIKELRHHKGKSQEIDFLASGMYLVRLFNNQSELLKTMRIQKN